jgi:hypothetical protein
MVCAGNEMNSVGVTSFVELRLYSLRESAAACNGHALQARARDAEAGSSTEARTAAELCWKIPEKIWARTGALEANRADVLSLVRKICQGAKRHIFHAPFSRTYSTRS